MFIKMCETVLEETKIFLETRVKNRREAKEREPEGVWDGGGSVGFDGIYACKMPLPALHCSWTSFFFYKKQSMKKKLSRLPVASFHPKFNNLLEIDNHQGEYRWLLLRLR